MKGKEVGLLDTEKDGVEFLSTTFCFVVGDRCEVRRNSSFVRRSGIGLPRERVAADDADQ